MDFVDLKTQYRRIQPEVMRRLSAVLDHGGYVMGPEVAELETRLAEFTGTKHCVVVASGTDALVAALMALEIGPGDEVITSPFSFIATAEAIALVGATPVFVDIEADSFNIDPDRIVAAITPRTRALMPVSLYGQCADFDEINRIAAEHGLPVIEDGAQSFGATYRGRKSCALTSIGCTSFFPSKPLGCYGDGGACFTADDALAEALREIRVHGQKARYFHTRLGINGRLDAMQCAVLLAKLEIFDDEITQRQQAANRYSHLLGERLPGLSMPSVRADCTSVWAQYTVRVSNREHIQAAMQAQGVPTAVHYPKPLHLQPVFAPLGIPEGALPVAEQAAREVLSLPLHPYLTADDQKLVVAALANALREISRS